MLDLKQINKIAQWRSLGKLIVLGTVFGTEGSTYSKQGKVIIINEDGEHMGLVSGGCLEDDIVSKGLECIRSGSCNILRYDLRTEESELWGLGAGCRGLINLFLQPINGFHDDLLEAVTALVTSGTSGEVATFVDLENLTIDAGTSILTVGAREYFFGSSESHLANFRSYILNSKSNKGSYMVNRIICIPNILILGAGLDAVPVVQLIEQLGWRVTVADYRESYFKRNDLGTIKKCRLENRDSIASDLDLEEYNVVIIMSHNLDADRSFVRQLQESTFDYIGILGPLSRKKMILEKLIDLDPVFKSKINGPVGLDIGADSAESIALALLAEIHQKLKKTTKG